MSRFFKVKVRDISFNFIRIMILEFSVGEKGNQLEGLKL